MSITFHHLRRAGAAMILAAALSACGVPGSGGSGSPTSLPAPQPGVAVQRPTATPVAADPGAPALNPLLGFEPQAGGPGTQVALWGSGVAPNAPVVIRLGFPAPTGEVLASATADADGRWAATLVIPENLPSGERITRAFNLVAMDAANQPLASAPFGFVVGAEAPAEPVESTLKYLWPVGAPADLTVQPFTSQIVGEGWLIHMAVPHATTPDVVISGDLIGEAPGQKLDDVTVRGLPAVTYAFAGGSAVVWQEDGHAYLVSGSRPLSVLLEIAAGLEQIDRATWEQRVRPQ